MFEEKLMIRADTRESRNRAGPSIHQVAICCFGKSQALSLVAVSQTLKKLIIRDLSADIELFRVNDRLSFKRVKGALNYATHDDFIWDGRVAYVSTRDVINSLSVHKFELEAVNSSERIIRDLLFIGCSSSIVVYDTYEQTNLFNIHTTCRITSLLNPEARVEQDAWPFIICGGVQKLYLIHMERLNPLLPTINLEKLVNIEIVSERSTSDTVSCLCYARCGGIDLVVTGSIEQKIRVYPLDTQDQNIQACSLTLNEPSKVNCICPIATVQPNDDENRDDQLPSALEEMARHSLPAIREQQQENQSKQFPPSRRQTQMNYFAYGLENGFIGVYRLISSCLGVEKLKDGQERLLAERLWRHKSRQVPINVLLYDVDGDGHDELVFGYSNGRLEARSPFTGQLVAKTRCFRSDQLIGLAVSKSVDFQERIPASIISRQILETMQDKTDSNNLNQTMLLACSVSMSFVTYWLEKSKPHKLMVDYFATRFDRHGLVRRTSAQSIDELEENENWTNSLIDFSSMGPEVPQCDQLEQTYVMSPQTDLFGIKPSDERYDPSQDLESKSDSLKSIQCEGKQNTELLCRLGVLHNDNNQLRRSLSKFYFGKVQQMSLFELDLLGSGIDLTYRWDFDASKKNLRLSVLVSDLTGVIELFELVDNSDNLIKSGHFLMNPCNNNNNNNNLSDNSWNLSSTDHASTLSVDSKTNLVLLPIESFNQETETRLRLRIYCLQLGTHDMISNQLLDPSWRNQLTLNQSSQPPVVLRVYEETILMPRFSMFVPEVALPQDDTSDGILTMSFKLEESTSNLQILNWMRNNFLCFKFGQLHNNDREHIWPLVDAGELVDAKTSISAVGEDQFKGADCKNSPPVSPLIGWNHNLPFDRVENWSSGRVGPNDEVELELKLRSIKPSYGQTKTFSNTRLRIACSLTRVLTIECQDVDVMVDIIESLVIDCLKLNIMENSIVSKRDGEPKLDAVDIELAAISEKTRQLEESEQRIQTELYESDDMIKNLMQQFAIANQLNEYKTSKELLNDISMMLNAAQNSAQAYQLNNRERLKMSKEANRLREKMSMLLKFK